MEFSPYEWAAITKIAQAMIEADGRVEANELNVLASEFQRFGVPEDLIGSCLSASRSMEASTAVALIIGLDKERKKYVAAFLETIMTIDGEIDKSEMMLLSMVSSLCGLPKMSIKEAVQYLNNL